MSKYSELAQALNDSAGHDLTIMDNAADALRELEAERDRLREALDEVCSNANPKFSSMRDLLVRDGIAMSGEIKHYEIAPHYIHRARAVLGGKR
jgi:hypothetical protein